MIPPLLDAVLGDYARNTKEARDAEVLNLMSSIVARLGVGLCVLIVLCFLLFFFVCVFDVHTFPFLSGYYDGSCTRYSGCRIRVYSEHD